LEEGEAAHDGARLLQLMTADRARADVLGQRRRSLVRQRAVQIRRERLL